MNGRIRGFEPVLRPFKVYKTDYMPPIRADKGSAGYDILSPVECVIQPNDVKLIWVDIKAYMLDDEFLGVYPRSSMGKVLVSIPNSIGIIDQSYYGNNSNDGNIGVLLFNQGDTPFEIKKGQAIVQGIFQKYLTADVDLTKKETRDGGFGSSD